MTMDHIKRSFQVSLHIKHPTIDPEGVSRALSISPRRTCKVGQPKFSPNGTPREGVYAFSYWAHDFETSGVTDLSKFLPSIIGRLGPHASYLLTLVREGGSIELF